MKKLIVIGLSLAVFAVGHVLAAPAAEPTTQTPKRTKKQVVKKSGAKKSSVNVEQVKTAQKKQPQSALQAWLKDMKKRVARSQAKQNQLVTVAAVRGSESADATPLYWKGKKAKGNAAPEEIAKFDEALDAAVAGEPVIAKEKLETFIASYPQSPLVSDAKETLARLTVEEPTNP